MGPDGRPDCGYCAERLRINVGLMEESRQLRARLAERDQLAPSLPEQSDTRSATTVEVAHIDLNTLTHYGLTVVSDCGVVKTYSDRDGCMCAIGPNLARDVASKLAAALNDAADLTEARSYGRHHA
jgi:hypothetical protein